MQQQGAAMSARLVEMLDEHCSHRTERRGCGFTQASRFLSDHINAARSPLSATDLGIFAGISIQRVEMAASAWLARGHASGWRRIEALVDSAEVDPFASQREILLTLRHALHDAHARAQTPGDRLLLQLIVGVIDGGGDAPSLPPAQARPKVGSCSQAEEFFLEIAHGKIRRGGSVNVIVDAHGAPLMIEKMNLGESHSAISLVPLRLNDVELPPGSLFALTHAPQVSELPRQAPVRRLALPEVASAYFLRLTTLSVPPAVRMETFSAQVEAQVRGNMVSPLTTTLEHLCEFAARGAAVAA